MDTMNVFEVYKELPGGRAIVKGEYRFLYPEDRVVVWKGDRSWSAVVETRTMGGAVVRIIAEV